MCFRYQKGWMSHDEIKGLFDVVSEFSTFDSVPCPGATSSL